MKDTTLAQDELNTIGEKEVAVPQSVEEVIAGLVGMGIEDFEEILTLESANRKIRLRISNITTEDEMVALMAVEGQKGYAWTQRVKCEILSRAVSWIAIGDGPGLSLRTLAGVQRIVTDPKDNVQKDIQVVLRNVITGWGEELVGVLCKVYMTHCQRVEDRLLSKFPDSATQTEVEKRFMANALMEIEDATKTQIRETVADIFKEVPEAPAPAA